MSMNVISYRKYLELNGKPPITDETDPNYDLNVVQCSISWQSLQGVLPENMIFTTCCKSRDLKPIFRAYFLPVFKDMIKKSDGTCPFCKKQLQASSIMTFSEKLYILAYWIFKGNGSIPICLRHFITLIGCFGILRVLYEIPAIRSVVTPALITLEALTLVIGAVATGTILPLKVTDLVVRRLGVEHSPIVTVIKKIIPLFGMVGAISLVMFLDELIIRENRARR